MRPRNPFRKNSTKWKLYEGFLQEQYDGLPGWSEDTIEQIAEILGKTKTTIYIALADIKKDSGVAVKHAFRRKDS